MNIIISVAIYKLNEIELNGKKYEVNDFFRKLCKKIFTLYVLLIGIICVLTVNLSYLVGADGIFDILLLVVLVLVAYNLLAEFLVKRFVLSRIQK